MLDRALTATIVARRVRRARAGPEARMGRGTARER